MPIKMLKFSFSLPVEAVLEAAAKYNTSLDIEAYREATDKTADETLAIEDQSKGSLRSVVLEHLKHMGSAVKLSDLKLVAAQHGHDPKQLSNALYILCVKKLVSRPAMGTYRITKRGSAA